MICNGRKRFAAKRLVRLSSLLLPPRGPQRVCAAPFLRSLAAFAHPALPRIIKRRPAAMISCSLTT